MNLRPIPFAISLLLVTTTLLLRGEDTPDAPVKDREAENERADALEKAADYVVHYTDDGKFDIGVGRLNSVEGREWKSLKSVYFEQDELVSFFDRQRHKDLIVILFHKSSRGSDAVRKEVAKMNAYFKDRGYKRIVIQQLLAFGRPILSDITVTP
jgi:hypothetical protein